MIFRYMAAFSIIVFLGLYLESKQEEHVKSVESRFTKQQRDASTRLDKLIDTCYSGSSGKVYILKDMNSKYWDFSYALCELKKVCDMFYPEKCIQTYSCDYVNRPTAILEHIKHSPSTGCDV